MDRWIDLPLFPLNTVLFPGMLLPLHVFEERYRLMIARCLDEQRPFGVVLIRHGQEVCGPAVPYDVGTTALIAGASQTSDGRYNLVTVGSERFRLHAVRSDQPYLVGSVELWPLVWGDEEDGRRQAIRVRALLESYLDLLVKAQGHRMQIDKTPDDSHTLALLVAIGLQVPVAEKQHLLCQPTLAELLRAERIILRRETLLLDYIRRTQADEQEGGYSGYLANN